MKKTLFVLATMLMFAFPALAQSDESEQVPMQILVLKKGNIPEPVLKTAEKLYSEDIQVKWGTLPEKLKNDGWLVEKDRMPIDHYEMLFKSKNGASVDAVFASTGDLISYREVNKSAGLPLDIVKEIQKSPYSKWNILSDSEVVTDRQNKIVEHFKVRMENGKQKKTLNFTREGNLLLNKA
jgi:hypothetical protein